MSPLTPFALFVAFIYSGVSIATAISFLLHYEYFWIGLLVMAVLLLAVLIEAFIQIMFVWGIFSEEDEQGLQEAIRSHDAKRVKAVKKCRRKKVLAAFGVPFVMMGLVAIIGIAILPVWVTQRFDDVLLRKNKEENLR